jgi:Tol biopolymer transport system component
MSNVEYAGGHLFYNREATLVALPFDADTGRLTGEPVTVVDNLQFNPSGNGAFAVSESGVLAFVTGDQFARRLMLFDRSGNSGRQIGPPGPYTHAELSPDGSRAVVERNAGARPGRETGPAARQLALMDMARSVLMPFTPGDNDEYDAKWTPDGSSVVFASRRAGTFGIYRRDAGGAATADELIYSSPTPVVPVDISSDGALLLIVRGQGPEARLLVLPTRGDREPVEALSGATGRPDESSFSPDGRWIAYSDIADLESEVYVQPYPADGRRIRISTSTGINPRWAPDGRRIVYRALDGAFYSVDLNPDGRTFRPLAPVRLFSQPPRAPTDHRYGADARLEKLLLTMPLDSGGAPAAPITVIVNFVQGLTR